jgi:hypothetical protein
MAGRLVVSTLNNDTGVLATQNGMTGIAKAWVNFAGASGAINGSFNVSSVTRSNTGRYTINFTTAMPNTNYVATIAQQYSSTAVMGQMQIFTTGLSSSVLPVEFANASAGAYADPVAAHVAVFSS